MISFFNRIFSVNTPLLETTDPMKKYLIAGLGNIGSDYVNTRHNIGFKILDAIAETENLNYEDRKLGKIARYKIKGRQVLLLKPNTYMNLSGKAVKYWLDKEKIPLENLLVITDDLNLPFDSIRLKTKGSAGGHNGLKDIQETLHTTQYNRFRFGISADFKKGRQVDYVLGTWSELEQDVLHKRLALTKKIIDSFILSGIQTTMNSYNGK
jgi:PTH1 family peptidyl-tRNA hydrolase